MREVANENANPGSTPLNDAGRNCKIGTNLFLRKAMGRKANFAGLI
jgi:hypothetical protein